MCVVLLSFYSDMHVLFFFSQIYLLDCISTSVDDIPKTSAGSLGDFSMSGITMEGVNAVAMNILQRKLQYCAKVMVHLSVCYIYDILCCASRCKMHLLHLVTIR